MIINVPEAFSQFRKLKASDLRNRVLPPELADLLKGVCETYRSDSDADRADIRRQVSYELSFLFFLFSTRMAERAVQENSTEYLSLSLIALLIEDCQFDSRDSTVALSRVYHSAGRIGIDPDGFFNEMTAISGKAMGGLLRAFVAREPANKRISVFRMKEGKDQNGHFVYTPSDER